MLLPNQWAINDPFPLQVRRPPKKTPADLEFESWLFKKIFNEVVKEKAIPKPYTFRSQELARGERGAQTASGLRLLEETRRWSARGLTPDVPGDYEASLSKRSGAARHWNGTSWSRAWGVNGLIFTKPNGQIVTREMCLAAGPARNQSVYFRPGKL